MTKKLSHETVIQAINGDSCAINKVLDYFHAYIVYLSKIETFDYNGNAYYYFDIDIQKELEIHLITKILDFEIRTKEE